MAYNLPLPYYPTAADAGINEADIYEYGNINLLIRVAKKTKEDPQAIETLRSISVQREITIGNIKKKVEIGIPTLDTDGNRLTNAQAEILYRQTGSHLGIFASPKVATKYLRKLSIASGQVQKTIAAASRVSGTDPLIPGISSVDYVTAPFDIYRDASIGALVKQSTIRQPKTLAELISIPEIAANSEAAKTISSNLTSVNVSYDIGATTEVALKFVDENFEMMENNYFVIRRVVKYRGREMEVAVVETGSEDGVPTLSVKLRSRAIQRMKRDKTPGNMTASNGYELAKKLAREYGLRFFGEQKPGKSQTVVTAKTNNNDDSAWTVLTRTAGDGESVCFEMDGCLIYASEKYLMGQFGLFTSASGISVIGGGAAGVDRPNLYIPLCYLPPHLLDRPGIANSDIIDAMKEFELITWPTFRSSENDVMEADGSCEVRRPNGCLIRPGHTVLVGPWPRFFSGYYLVSSVSFSEGTNDPISIEFKTPTKPESQKNKPTVGIKPGKTSFASFKVTAANTSTTS